MISKHSSVVVFRLDVLKTRTETQQSLFCASRTMWKSSVTSKIYSHSTRVLCTPDARTLLIEKSALLNNPCFREDGFFQMSIKTSPFSENTFRIEQSWITVMQKKLFHKRYVVRKKFESFCRTMLNVGVKTPSSELASQTDLLKLSWRSISSLAPLSPLLDEQSNMRLRANSPRSR